jgi:hypothetical protein
MNRRMLEHGERGSVGYGQRYSENRYFNRRDVFDLGLPMSQVGL